MCYLYASVVEFVAHECVGVELTLGVVRKHRYILWSIMAVVVHFGRRTLTLVVTPAERIREWPAWGWAAALALFGGLALLCIAREAVRYRANTKTE